MIELIFVIVIIGILAAVAIPKLAATRDDAKIANIIANARTLAGDLGAYYTAQGASAWDTNGSIGTATNVDIHVGDCTTPLDENTTIGTNTFVLCADPDNPCLEFVTGGVATGTSGRLTVQAGSGTAQICADVVGDPAIQGMLGVQDFGGKSVVR
jgi:general secretion pathway protein G